MRFIFVGCIYFFINVFLSSLVSFSTSSEGQSSENSICATEQGPYYVEVYDSGLSGVSKVQMRACSTEKDCGDIIDWTDVIVTKDTNFFAGWWSFPSFVWSALPYGISYISARVFDGAENITVVSVWFCVNKSLAFTSKISSQG